MVKKSKDKKKAADGKKLGLVVSDDGRMLRGVGQRCYDLLSCLAEIAVPLLEATTRNLRKDNDTPLGWKNGPNSSITSNSIQLRTIVVTFILRSSDLLVEQIHNNEHATLYCTIVSPCFDDERLKQKFQVGHCTFTTISST